MSVCASQNCSSRSMSMSWARDSSMVKVQCIGEGGTEGKGPAEDEGRAGSVLHWDVVVLRLPAGQPPAMAAISFVWFDVNLSQRSGWRGRRRVDNRVPSMRAADRRTGRSSYQRSRLHRETAREALSRSACRFYHHLWSHLRVHDNHITSTRHYTSTLFGPLVPPSQLLRRQPEH